MSAVRAVEASARIPRWLSVTILAVTGLFYAFAIWNAVGALADLASNLLGLSAYGWGVLVFAVLFPALVFAGGVAIGLRRTASQLALVMVTGLSVVAVFWICVVSLVLTSPLSFLPVG